MKKITAAYISELCNGTLVGEDVQICGVVRDNREVSEGNLFVAISGEKFDGHDFVSDAAKKGASAALVSRRLSDVDISQIVVENTIDALGEIARGYLESLDIKRVCVTGSVGKTTTKEMCAAVLSKKFKTHKTQGNYNNNIGLPITIFSLEEEHEAAVLEIGTNHFGEILPLAKIANPHVALITNIGESHLEAFGTKEGVLKEKTEILKGLTNDGVAVLNGDDPLLWGERDKLSCKAIWFGLKNRESDVFGEIVENGIYESVFRVRGSDIEFRLSCGGEHNIRDALSAIAVAKVFGMDDVSISEGLLSFKNTGMRQDIYEYEGITIIRDCYNANPESMKASVLLLSKSENKNKRICVLGDMLELGENASIMHQQVGAAAAECADMIFVTGNFASDYEKGAGKEKTLVFENKEMLAKKLKETLCANDIVLVKGSYGTKMWQVLEYLQGERV